MKHIYLFRFSAILLLSGALVSKTVATPVGLAETTADVKNPTSEDIQNKSDVDKVSLQMHIYFV